MAAILSLFLTLFFLFFPLQLLHAQLPPFINEGGGIDPTKTPVYIVHVQKPPFLARNGHLGRRSLRFRDLRNWYMSFLPNATLSNGEPRMIYAYRVVITGFAARLYPEEVEAMEDMEGFITAYPEKEHPAHTTYTPIFLGLKGNAKKTLWPDSSKGAGQIIGVIDTGIIPNHTSFGEDGMPLAPTKWKGKCYWGNSRTCNNKLLGAVGFHHGINVDPFDNNGHGTHVASTAAGKFIKNANLNSQAPGTASGMAPQAHLAIYKVIFVNPSGQAIGTDADILAGIEQAIHDNVDILQMSLGAPYQELFKSPIAIGSFAAMKKGIAPCAAMANWGPKPSILANDAPWILTVGASTTDRKITASVLLGNGIKLAGESAYQPNPYPSTQLPLAFPYASLKSPKSLGCLMAELNKLKLNGSIVLCFRYYIQDDERGRNVLNSGGAAMLILNDRRSGETTNAYAHVLPASHLNKKSSDIIMEYYDKTASPTASLLFRGTEFGVNPSPAIAAFSSRGPSLTNGGIIKPDVIAPGVNILAASPKLLGPTESDFNFMSGTSMATPHLAGVVALLRSKYPTWSPAAIKSAIMTTAYTSNREANPITDDFNSKTATVFQRGAGHIDPEAATKPGLVYELNHSNYVDYLCGFYKSNVLVGLIVKLPVNCAQVKAIEPEQLNYPSFGISLGERKPDVTVTRWVTNVGDAESAYEIGVEEPDGVRVEVTPMKLQFSRVGEELSYQVKFSLKEGLLAPEAGEVKDGRLSLDSGEYSVKSPIAVTFL